MMAVVSGVVYIDKDGEERDKKYYGACFAPLCDFPVNYQRICKEILYIYYPLTEQQGQEMGLSGLQSEKTQAILYDIYHYMNLQPFLYNTYEDCLKTGMVKVRADYDGRFVFNTLSYFRQFFEYAGFYYFYVLYRESGASPLEAFVLASSFRVGYSFRSRKEEVRMVNLEGHSATGFNTWLPINWNSFKKGMNPEKNKGEFFKFPSYLDRIRMVGINYDEPGWHVREDNIKQSFLNGGVPQMIETWRNIVNE